MTAYEFRSIADVELKDQPVDSTTVIIEQDGVLARVPKDKVGVTSYNDLKDKPNYAALEVAEAEEEVSNVLVECDGTLKRAPKNYVGTTSYEKLEGKPGDKVIIEWDGNTEGRDSVDISRGNGIYAYKVSDSFLTKEELTNSVVTISTGETDFIPLPSIIQVDGGIIAFDGTILVATNTTITSEGITLTVPSTGIYFASIYGEHISSLKCTKKIPAESVTNIVQTAIFKIGNYDDVLLGNRPAGTEINCANMTFDEAWNLLTFGNPLNAIIMKVQDSNNLAMQSALGLGLDLPNNKITIPITEDIHLYWTADGITSNIPE